MSISLLVSAVLRYGDFFGGTLMGSRWSTKDTVSHLMDQARQGVAWLKERSSAPHLAVIIVGDDPASHVYVRRKVEACSELGVKSTRIDLPEDVTESEMLDEVKRLNQDDDVDGILVQLPLPSQVSANAVIEAIDPDKDVDGFHPVNVGRLALGQAGLFPCTPVGVMALMKQSLPELKGKHAVVIGRSAIVGKPMAHLLLHAHCSVTIIHSRTPNPQSICQLADIVVVAVGRPGLVDGSWLKPGAVVVDVGINEIKDKELARRLFGEDSKKYARFMRSGRALVGDVDYRSALGVAAWVTPVPGGVGRLTIAQLMLNCVTAAKRRLS